MAQKTVAYVSPIAGATITNATLTFDNQGLITAGSSGSGASAILLDDLASPTYPTAPQTQGVWYGTNAKAGCTGGAGCVAIGSGITASGVNSTAIGLSAAATDDDAIAIGDSAQANGYGCIALGVGATASTDFDIAIGNFVTANGGVSTAIGLSATASGNVSIALGSGAAASGTRSVGIGSNSAAAGAFTVAAGETAHATQDYDCAIGAYATANAGFAFAMGVGASATGAASFAMGNNAQCTNAQCFAVGQGTITSGYRSVAIASGGFTNSVAETMVFVSSAAEQFRMLAPATGNHSFLLVASTQNGASPQTLTAAQALGGYQRVTTTGAFTLNFDTGANLDANAQLAGNLYVGLSFRCTVVGEATTVLTLAGATGSTLRGIAAVAAGAAVDLLFFRTGANAWDVIATHA